MIVAIESASTDLSLALTDDAGQPIAVDGWRGDRRQGHEVLPRLLALLESERRGLEEVGAVAVGIGPGSFTGLRVGMSLAKGLAFGLRARIVGIPSLQAWLAAEPGTDGALARAGAREAYLLTRDEAGPRVVDRDALAGSELSLVAAAELAEAFGLSRTRSPRGSAQAMARLAAERLTAQPGGDDLASLEPSYLRAPRGIGQVPAGGIEWR